MLEFLSTNLSLIDNLILLGGKKKRSNAVVLVKS